MPWHAKPGYAEHHRAAVERIVNTLPPHWLQPPHTGELFAGLEQCNSRLRGYALAEGFAKTTDREIIDIRRQLGQEEGARFNA
jgi:hypothetical protein